jgi:hypothetical protein
LGQVLEAFPTGSTLYNPKKYAYRPSDPTSADYQRLLNFWMSTDFVLWEVRTKVTIIKKYILVADSWSKLLAVGTHSSPHTLTTHTAHARTHAHTAHARTHAHTAHAHTAHAHT